MSKHKNQKGKLDVAAFESVTPRMPASKEDVGKRVLALLRKIKKEEDMASQGSGSAWVVARSEMADEIYNKVKALVNQKNT